MNKDSIKIGDTVEYYNSFGMLCSSRVIWTGEREVLVAGETCSFIVRYDKILSVKQYQPCPATSK